MEIVELYDYLNDGRRIATKRLKIQHFPINHSDTRRRTGYYYSCYDRLRARIIRFTRFPYLREHKTRSTLSVLFWNWPIITITFRRAGMAATPSR